MMRVFRFAWAILILLAGPAQGALQFEASVDRHEVAVNESFWLTLRLSGTRSAFQPELAPLREHFEILRTTSEQSMRQGPGGTESAVAWRVELMALSAGEKQIPSFEQSGLRTVPITLQVHEARSASGELPEVFVETELDKQSVRVGEQMLLRTRLFSSVPLTRGELTEPRADGLTVLRLGDDLNYVAQRGGRSYEVVERRFAMFAQAAGTLRLEGVGFRGQTPAGRARSRGLSLFEQQRTLAAQATAVQITVLDPPEGWVGAWLPAADVQIEEHWAPSRDPFVVGEPLTRSVRITAVGVRPEQLPAVTMSSNPNIHSYPEKATVQQALGASGLQTQWQQSTALVPAAAGSFRLPEIAIPWWDTTTQSARIARLPARTVTVIAATAPAGPAPAAEAPVSVATRPPTPLTDWPVLRRIPERLWPGLLLGMAGLWLATLFGWWWSAKGRRPVADKVKDDAPMSQRAAARQLSAACRRNDPLAAVQAWRQWSRARWPAQATANLLQIADRLQADADAVEALWLLNWVVYGAEGPDAWDGGAHWQAVRQLMSADAGSSAPVGAPDLLPALHPH